MVLICPTISLINSHLENLKIRGIPCASLGPSSGGSLLQSLSSCDERELPPLVFTTPEYFAKKAKGETRIDKRLRVNKILQYYHYYWLLSRVTWSCGLSLLCSPLPLLNCEIFDLSYIRSTYFATWRAPTPAFLFCEAKFAPQNLHGGRFNKGKKCDEVFESLYQLGMLNQRVNTDDDFQIHLVRTEPEKHWFLALRSEYMRISVSQTSTLWWPF